MIKENNDVLLKTYINNTGIANLFSKDMTPYFELFSLAKGDYLITEGQCSEYLYFLVNGKVKVFSHSTSGKVMSLNHFNSFEIIGEACSLWDKPPTASVQSTSKAYCLGISMKYKEIILNDVTFLRYMCQNLGERLSYMNNNTCINLYDPLESRLAYFILKTEKDNIFSYNLTECSELLCASYRHLLRVINSFCNSNILSKSGKSYRIINKDFLQKVASNSLDIE